MSEFYHTEQSPDLKACRCCHQEKALNDFSQRKDGRYEARCKDCMLAADRERNYKRRPRKTPTIPRTTREGFKICNTCLIEKEHASFKHDYQKKDTYASRCKQCDKDRWNALAEEQREQERKRDRERRLTRIEQIRARDRKRHNTDENRAKRRERNHIKREKRLLELQMNPPIPERPKEKKHCIQCNTIKAMNDFPLNKGRKDGHGSYCKGCMNAKGRSEENRAREREYRRNKKQFDPEYRRRRQEQLNQWRRQNPCSQHELTLRRLARKKAATTERVNLKHILERDGYWCYICEAPIDPTIKKGPASLAFDHVVPLIPRSGEPQGTHCEANLRPVHKACNSRKNNKQFKDLTNEDRRGV